MGDYTCPICGACYKESEQRQRWAEKDPCRASYGNDEDFVDLYCHHLNFRFMLHKDIYYMENSDLKEQLLNLVAEHVNHSKGCVVNDTTRLWYFHYSDIDDERFDGHPNHVNLSNQLNNYPTQAIEVAHRSLVNYARRYPHYGDNICPCFHEKRLSFEHEGNNNHSCGVMKLLQDLGHVKDPNNDGCYVITATGWQKIDELRKEEQIVHQGFIAMSFREETKPIREAFRKAMKQSGYSVAVIDEKEHNNQIVPEIFYEIERSKFVVVDVTYPNYGAYYEAGYAQALGKQVIICCRKAEFDDKGNPNRPHFDIAQKAMIVWEDEDDLIHRLKRRIEATVK